MSESDLRNVMIARAAAVTSVVGVALVVAAMTSPLWIDATGRWSDEQALEYVRMSSGHAPPSDEEAAEIVRAEGGDPAEHSHADHNDEDVAKDRAALAAELRSQKRLRSRLPAWLRYSGMGMIIAGALAYLATRRA